MSKVSGSYESVVRGVSEQVPQDRRSGQHFEQINLVSDPVRGLARRHGSVMQDEQILTLPDASYDALLTDTANHKVITFFVDGVEYDLIHRTAADTGALGEPAFAWAFNKDSRVFIPIVYADTDPVLDALVSGGVSASANVGRYLFLAGNTVEPTWTPVAAYDDPANTSKLAGWVRGGAYSRTYTMTLIRPDGTEVAGTYKTVSSSYPTLLDTSDILTADPDYQKKVNDRVNAYNSEVTKWIGTSAADITPENIAAKLVLDFATKGVTALAIGGTVVIDDTQFIEAKGEDGGDGTLLRVVGNEVTSAELVSVIHYAGKVVRIRPRKSNGDDAFYLKAYPQVEGHTGWGEVSWREAAGYVMQPLDVFVQGTVEGGTLYLASSATKLSALVGFSTPAFKANAVGDDITSPLPYFFGKRIDYLGVFQDRLVIGSGAVLLFSKPGDYFNWFRQSVLTVADNDPAEIFALGSEDDTIRASVTYDRNLLLFGLKKQYTVNGRQPFTPKTGSVVILSAYKDTVDAPPQVSGNLVFYCKQSGRAEKRSTTVHQIQTGQLADTPESFNMSQALDRYLKGSPVQILAVTAPNCVFVRTDKDRQALYTYTYLDSAQGNERLFDSWSTWRWSPFVGDLIGLGSHSTDILAYFVRHGVNAAGEAKVWIAAERFSLDTGLSDLPHADSLRPAPDTLLGTGDAYIHPLTPLLADGCIAFEAASPLAFLGTPLDRLDEFDDAYGDDLEAAWVGIQFPAYVTPTNPYMRDRNDKAITSGRLTLGRIGVSIADSGGFRCTVTTASGTAIATDYNGRVLGRATNLVGRQPIVTTTVSVSIGKEVRECSYTLSAKTWLPFTLTGIEWVGQSFNNSRRA